MRMLVATGVMGFTPNSGRITAAQRRDSQSVREPDRQFVVDVCIIC